MELHCDGLLERDVIIISVNMDEWLIKEFKNVDKIQEGKKAAY